MRTYHPSNHISNLINNEYYLNLIQLRSDISSVIDNYFTSINAPKVDLYMVTGSVSSPMGKGSDSEPWPIKMGDINTHLVDSAQFGMEPLVQKRFDLVYCYLPSFRGETPDDHHLNQFYHCEAEMKGNLESCILLAQGLMGDIKKYLINSASTKLVDSKRIELLGRVFKSKFERITFDEACKALNNSPDFVQTTKYGRRITRAGEAELSKRLFNNTCIFWLTNFDRDMVPFYQKPDPSDKEKILNADLIVPKIGSTGFYGEILGLGQRQDNVDEIMESIRRQAVHNPEVYNWYIELRKSEDYVATSGFGLGIERLISWIIGTDDIASAAIYPVQKDIKTVY